MLYILSHSFDPFSLAGWVPVTACVIMTAVNPFTYQEVSR